MLLVPYDGKLPKIHPTAFVAPTATLIGDVEIGEDASVWFGAVLRGDVMPIRVGARSNIQDNSVVHSTGGWTPTLIGEDVTVGHGVILHGCQVGDRVLVGMGSILLDASQIGSETVIAAGSLVTTKCVIPSGVTAMGRPAKVARPLQPSDLEMIRVGSHSYVEEARRYRAQRA